MSIEQLRRTGQLPSPKGVALSVMRLAHREDVTMEEIAEVVETDPALTGRLLRLANSALYAARPVVAVRDAIVRLGLRTVSQVTLGFSLVDQYQKGPCEAFGYQEFWSQSLLMAVAARELGHSSGVGSGEELFACGLLAQIGRLALATAYPAEYADVLRRADGDPELLLELERETLQIDHEECTAEMLSDFGIPKALVEPVRHHERPQNADFSEGSRPYRILHLLFLARRVADLGSAPETEWNTRVSELLVLGGRIGLDEDALGALVDRAVDEWRRWSELLRVPAPFVQPFAKMSRAEAPRPEAPEEPAALRVLLIEEDVSARLLLSGMLSRLGHTVYSAVTAEEALALALEVMPQVVVTDCALRAADGLDFCRALRATDWGQSIYLIMLTDNEEEVSDRVDAGADDYVTKPVSVRTMRARLRAATHYANLLQGWENDRMRLRQLAAELAISNRRLEHAALTDLLTGLPNRRAGVDFLNRAFSATARSGQPLTVMVIAVDRFEAINDARGHAVGDRILVAVATALRAAVRRGDHVCRRDGEEFVMVCLDTDAPSVMHAAERLCGVARSIQIDREDPHLRITLSIGVAGREPETPDADALTLAAEEALQSARRAGGDQVHPSPGESTAQSTL